MSRFANNYPPDWPLISQQAKAAAGFRCVRCFHPFNPGGSPECCDGRCDESRGFHVARGLATPYHVERLVGINYGVHHLDGDKANSAWWNLLPLDNSCHLNFQARVIPEQHYMHEHSPWFRPFVAGYYAAQRGLVVTRADVEADIERFLAMGQPHLYAVRA